MKKFAMLLVAFSMIVLCCSTALASEAEVQETPRIVIDEDTGAKAIIYDENVEIRWEKVDYSELYDLDGNVHTLRANLSRPSTPFTDYDWSEGNPYRFDGHAQISNVYSDFRFTGMIACSLFMQNNLSTDAITVEFVRVGGLFNVFEFEVQPKTGVMPVISGLDADEKYYFVVCPPSNFEGRLYPHFP